MGILLDRMGREGKPASEERSNASWTNQGSHLKRPGCPQSVFPVAFGHHARGVWALLAYASRAANGSSSSSFIIAAMLASWRGNRMNDGRHAASQACCEAPAGLAMGAGVLRGVGRGTLDAHTLVHTITHSLTGPMACTHNVNE